MPAPCREPYSFLVPIGESEQVTEGMLGQDVVKQTEVIVLHGLMPPHHGTCSATQASLCRARGGERGA